jgi:hypothetical protein
MWHRRHRAALGQTTATWSILRQLKQRSIKSTGTDRRGAGGSGGVTALGLRCPQIWRVTTCHPLASASESVGLTGVATQFRVIHQASAMKAEAAV